VVVSAAEEAINLRNRPWAAGQLES
jgi:hypothetical protein